MEIDTPQDLEAAHRLAQRIDRAPPAVAPTAS
jgi:hypothetical protein